MVGPFRLHRKLERGDAFALWEARLDGDRPLPVIARIRTAAAGEQLRYDAALDVEREALQRLRHAGVPRAIAYGSVTREEASARPDLTPGANYLVMEHIDGEVLRTSLLPGSWTELRVWLLEMLSIVGSAHAAGVHHLDLNPDNVVVRRDKTRTSVAVLNFGGARIDGFGGTGRRRDGGTPGFVAPEQFLPELGVPGPSTDLYAIGAMAFLLATGMAPFPGTRVNDVRSAQVNGRLRPFAPLFPVPLEAEDWIVRLLRPTPEERIASADDALIALECASDDIDASFAFTPALGVDAYPGRTVEQVLAAG